MYNKELAQLRNAVDSIAKEKAKLELEADKGAREAKEAKTELSQNEKRLEASERGLANKTQRLLEVESRLSTLEDDVRRLRPENTKLAKQLEDAKRNLEDETLKRTDLQNQLQTKEESLKFENSMLEQQLNETKVKKQIEISEIDGRLSDEYEAKLQQSLAVRSLIKGYSSIEDDNNLHTTLHLYKMFKLSCLLYRNCGKRTKSSYRRTEKSLAGSMTTN